MTYQRWHIVMIFVHAMALKRYDFKNKQNVDWSLIVVFDSW